MSYLDLREDGVPSPRISGEHLVVVCKSDRGPGRRVSVLSLKLVLVQRREVVRLEWFVAGSARDTSTAHALAAGLVTLRADGTAQVAPAVHAAEQVVLLKISKFFVKRNFRKKNSP